MGPQPVNANNESELSSSHSRELRLVQSSNSQRSNESRYFQPHRTIGLVTTSKPFSFSPNASTSTLDTFITVPLLDRFVLYRCDSLRPVLVSDSLPSSNYQTGKKRGEERMHSAISDSSLSVTVATHSPRSFNNATHATLYNRTKVVMSKVIARSKTWAIVDTINLGRSKFQHSNGKNENAIIIAMICANNRNIVETENNIDVFGESDGSDDGSSSEDNSVDSFASSTDDTDDVEIDDREDDHLGEVVIVLASRTMLQIQNRIILKDAYSFRPSVGMHPHTYLNKIIIGSDSEEMLLLNIRSEKIVHKFKCIEKKKDRIRNFGISVFEQSPVVDTIAVGTCSGKVHLVNIRMDVNLFTIDHFSPSKNARIHGNEITSLSFRTDGSSIEHGIAPLAVGQKNGSISIWDLTPRSEHGDDVFEGYCKSGTRTLLCQIDQVHRGGVSKLSFIPQEPLLLSSGCESNSLIMHVFDNPNHSGRILRQRVGHSTPPELIRYLHSSSGSVLASMADGTDAASCQILSCGGKGDLTFRLFSTARSVLDCELSQGKGLVKKAAHLGMKGGKVDLLLNKIVGIASTETKAKDWGDLVTIHQDHAFGYVWSTKNKSQSGPVLRQMHWNVSAMKIPPPTSAHATSIAVSSCGNFAVIGTKGGVIYKYNMQSGISRGSFPQSATEKDDRLEKRKNLPGNISRTMRALERDLKISNPSTTINQDKTLTESEVRWNAKQKFAQHKNSSVMGMAIDGLNKTLISVGSDAKLILWSFKTHSPLKCSPMILSSPATKLAHVRDSDLVAISLEDFSVILFDFSSLAIVRKFGIRGNISRHTGRITDMAFGPDGRTLFTSSLDMSVRVWDVPTNMCIDWMHFSTPPTSLALSTTGEFLATTHVGRLGISLWCDRSFFQTVHLDGSKPLLEPFRMNEPAALAEEWDNNEQKDIEDKVALTENASQGLVNELGSDSTSEEISKKVPPKPKQDSLITLSNLPSGHWKSLFNLELIKERNKPTEAPKKPPSAPFFLQWRNEESPDDLPTDKKDESELNSKPSSKKLEEEEWNSVWSEDEDAANKMVSNNLSIIEENDSEKKRKVSDAGVDSLEKNDQITSSIIKKKKISHFRSDLAALLIQCSENTAINPSKENIFEPVTRHMATMGPSAIDIAFSTLCNGIHDLDEGLHLLQLTSQWLLETCQSRQSYDAFNAYLHRFLYIHSDVIAGIDDSNDNYDNNKVGKTDEGNTHLEERRLLLTTIRKLRKNQREAADDIRDKMQHTLCLLRHFSRMV